jgi:hypothetical protein
VIEVIFRTCDLVKEKRTCSCLLYQMKGFGQNPSTNLFERWLEQKENLFLKK